MIDNLVSLPWQLTGGFLTLITILLALYGLLLDPRRLANQLVSLAMFLLAAVSVGVLLTTRAYTTNAVITSHSIIAAVAPATGPALILAALSLLKRKWISGRMVWLRIFLLALILVPLVFVVLDLFMSAGIYLAPEPAGFSARLVKPMQMVQGVAGKALFQTGLVYMQIGLILFVTYVSFLDRPGEPRLRSLARLILGTLIFGWSVHFILVDSIPAGYTYVLSGSIVAYGYAYAAYKHMGITRSLPAGGLSNRLTRLATAITIPLLVFIAFFLLDHAERLLIERSTALLEEHTTSQRRLVDQSIHDRIAVLQSLALQPEILSMDPAQQKPALARMLIAYPSLTLISTTDLSGMNVARSDENELVDYSDRLWFQRVLNGEQSVLQALPDRTIGEPVLVIAVPILAGNGTPVGVCMATSRLADISSEELTAGIGETGYAYIVDDQDQLVAHPRIEPGSGLLSVAGAPPVAAMRDGLAPPLIFTDENGIEWLATYQPMSNDWGVVVQQQMQEFTSSVRPLQQITAGITGLGCLLLLGLLAFTIRQGLQPLEDLVRMVKEIASGSLTRLPAPVESDDEIGILAKVFNSMTLETRNLVDALERRVAERTLDLEHRSAQLQIAADVGRAAANIRSLDELLPLVTRLVSERFGFYHVGIFLIDEEQQYCILRAANSEGGQKMLVRGHRLQIGQQGIVGYVSKARQPRIALNVGQDAVYFSNPDLPDTQSEMALPLVVATDLLGVLDVQSTEQSAFSEQDVRTMQVLADQIAIAINRARLVEQLEQSLEAERRAYGEISRQSWQEQVREQAAQGYSRTPAGVIPLREIDQQAVRSVIRAGKPAIDPQNTAVCYFPVKVRSVGIGVIKLARAEMGGSWADEDIEFMEKLAEQLGVALESARAYQATRTSAQRERILAEISTHVRQTLDVDMILRAASREVRQRLGLPKVIIQIASPPPASVSSAGSVQPEPVIGVEGVSPMDGVDPVEASDE
jgi:GAF domain-containing protein/HAMP domain-containing protein